MMCEDFLGGGGDDGRSWRSRTPFFRRVGHGEGFGNPIFKSFEKTSNTINSMMNP